MVLLEMVCELVGLCEPHVSFMQYGCVWFYVKDVGMTYSDRIMQVHNEKKWRKTTSRIICADGARLSRSEGPQKGSVMDEDWEISSGSEFVPSEAGPSTEDTVSLVEGNGEDVGVCGSDSDDTVDIDADSGYGSGKGKVGRERGNPSWKVDGGGVRFAFDKDGRGVRGIVPVSMRGRCTLKKICKFNKTLEPYQRKAIEGTILKLILEYRPFSMQGKLTTALAKVWVPRRKEFRLAGRLVPCFVFTNDGKRAEFGEDDLSMTELARMVQLRMAQYVTEKSGKLKRKK
ncbi:hypothetical protein Cgig2_003414 [Carnegiea gigantea]|uniref:Uncharacterized protein n=1 Tax=Carnegiea gigantea TaxID=171969 RepID=A0A9Q1QF38_9CARY|nr:hypothetical protein Cgig2_003414 [Carnegiea gigantea]